MKINGLLVENATKKITISITKNDVKKSNSKDPASCAAAKACLRLDNVTEARVHLSKTYLKINNIWNRFDTPKALRTEIISFDRAHVFDPGEYTLTPCSPVKRTNKQQGSITNQTNRNPKKKRAAPHVVTGVRAHGANK